MEQLALSFAAPIAPPIAVPMESDESRGVYFWQDTSAQYSTHPHALLPFHCAAHGRYSDKPCPAELHTPEELALRRRLDAMTTNDPKRRKWT